MAVAAILRAWTLEELHRLPDDGNKYELVRGELFVTPPPTGDHETVAARLNAMLVPYVESQRLGHVYFPKSVVRFEGSQVEPDLMVRREHPAAIGSDKDWDSWPAPLLVVEIASPHTRLRDRGPKRELYIDARIPEYWMLEREQREIRIVKPGMADVVARDSLVWMPAGASKPLTVDVASLFA